MTLVDVSLAASSLSLGPRHHPPLHERLPAIPDCAPQARRRHPEAFVVLVDVDVGVFDQPDALTTLPNRSRVVASEIGGRQEAQAIKRAVVCTAVGALATDAHFFTPPTAEERQEGAREVGESRWCEEGYEAQGLNDFERERLDKGERQGEGFQALEEEGQQGVEVEVAREEERRKWFASDGGAADGRATAVTGHRQRAELLDENLEFRALLRAMLRERRLGHSRGVESNVSVCVSIACCI